LQSGGEHFSDGSDSEESLGPETLQSGFSVPPVCLPLCTNHFHVLDMCQFCIFITCIVCMKGRFVWKCLLFL